ncbi:NAD(P)-dependent dehydrogenase (short-subunit alcohol dehydrogenase family) [Novosphingobium chloroacetimidivorans]|uniref:NAD(P)-dependent dehydrogenase (Short-subunit alcohol dehydrogenase family) n=1 Tax=Novosphingobium chloroacetimidivorans TaxID=1428314 RepID=A0A7W7KA39_9SPHN|nr:SDR family NAD(P)-dependent oxidoreductase [Novosphingobium chloroacetimidivorans]MBB4858736.1 NAD(P)-dependent dehydrogenase (short-subunit alcohol dehydrogenase family) [Novosphingobium chloroacetimidivorans]
MILVTGAGRGLGKAYATLLAERGASVIVADNGSTMGGESTATAPADDVAAAIRAAGGRAISCTADLAQEAGAGEAITTALDAFGRIDGIIHNASTVPELAGPDRLSTPDLDFVLRINVHAGLWLARAAWPHFVKRGYGRMVLTSSAAIYGAEGNMSYAAAKAASIGMMRCLAVEGRAAGIMVNAVAPSASTRMTERHLVSDYAQWFHQTMQPEKVAAAVAYLMHDTCAINGEILAIGGGRIARVVLGESRGAMSHEDSIEAVAMAMPEVVAQQDVFYPTDLAERSSTVARMFAVDGNR